LFLEHGVVKSIAGPFEGVAVVERVGHCFVVERQVWARNMRTDYMFVPRERAVVGSVSFGVPVLGVD
jgi:hypothetical protein